MSMPTYRQPAGSSPRMRGAPAPVLGKGLKNGIIPADAGSTTRASAPSAPVRDHPRGCGEHMCLLSCLAMPMGSSPRMRGAHRAPSWWPSNSWIIPADAGSTTSLLSEGQVSEDHPRGCGEHLPATANQGDYMGSSPRMRGALVRIAPCRACRGIIPADAGSTISHCVESHCSPDHPRGCGEHAFSG